MNFTKLAVSLACVASAAASLPAAALPDAALRAVTAPVSPLSVAGVNAVDQQTLVTAGSKGNAVLRAQILLDRARFSTGEIDGSYGSNTRRAIEGYQTKNGLTVSGTVDAATWTALNLDTVTPLITYTIQDADVAGPFKPVPSDMADKAKMTALGYSSAIEGLGEKFHVSPATLKRLNPGKDFTRALEEIMVPNVLGTAPLPKASRIVIDKDSGTLTLMDMDGKMMARYPATTGSEHDPLPIGKEKVTGISMNPVFYYNPKLFWDAEPGEQKAKIPGGPNNPVGVAWIDLTKEHYGIHGTPVPSTIGKTQSHGCIRLTNWDVKAVSTAVATGTEVIMQ